MGMPITVEIIGISLDSKIFSEVFNYFRYIDNKFSTYKKTSEIIKINSGKLNKNQYSNDMKSVLKLCEKTKRKTNGFFDIEYKGKLDPSGLVKGWAVQNTCKFLKKRGIKNFFIEAGGDIQVSGKNKNGQKWKIGIQNPFNRNEIIKVITVKTNGVATSGTYIRGHHIYNPFDKLNNITNIVSFTVVGPNIFEADRFVTAAFAMGKNGISFIESLPGFEGYMIDKYGIATYTSGFGKYVV